MKKRVMKGMGGKEVTIFYPENEADIEELKRMENEKQIDSTDYMHGETKQKPNKGVDKK